MRPMGSQPWPRSLHGRPPPAAESARTGNRSPRGGVGYEIRFPRAADRDLAVCTRALRIAYAARVRQHSEIRRSSLRHSISRCESMRPAISSTSRQSNPKTSRSPRKTWRGRRCRRRSPRRWGRRPPFRSTPPRPPMPPLLRQSPANSRRARASHAAFRRA